MRADPTPRRDNRTIETSAEVSIKQPSLRALGKRRAIDNDKIPLPDFDIQRRSSGRFAKGLRYDTDCVYNK
jgi:hypothetical protein